MKFYFWEQVDKGWKKENSTDTFASENVIGWLIDKCIELEFELNEQETTLIFRNMVVDFTKHCIK